MILNKYDLELQYIPAKLYHLVVQPQEYGTIWNF